MIFAAAWGHLAPYSAANAFAAAVAWSLPSAFQISVKADGAFGWAHWGELSRTFDSL